MSAPLPAMTFHTDGTPDGVRAVLGRIKGAVEDTGVTSAFSEGMELALAEALNNIVEHAYAGVPDGVIDIGITMEAQSVAVELRDMGVQLPGLTLPDGCPVDASTPVQDLPEGGFGWLILRAMTSELAYERRRGQNILRLQFDLQPEHLS